MSAALRHVLATGTIGLGLQLAVGCNAALGIEQAELEQTEEAAPTCGRAPRDPTVDCADPNCESCFNRCADSNLDVVECLNDFSCRKALLLFRSCAGDSCDRNPSCAGCFTLAGNQFAERLGKCFDGCAGCSPADIASLCDLYCACMQDHCDENEPADCLQTCRDREALEGKEQWRTYCLLDHCQRAGKNDNFHCRHAIGLDGMCGDDQFPASESPHSECPLPKAFENGACNTWDDCCSGECSVDEGACK